MSTENIRLRSEFLNTQVIARDTGKRLGVVKEVLVDMDRREVVALGLRENILAVSGILKYMYLNSICLLYTSPSPRDQRGSRMPSSA